MDESPRPDLPILRGLEEAAESFARLDEVVANSASGLASLLMLRSAQAIVATQPGPLDAAVRGTGAFAALLGWWFAAESREFVADDRTLRQCALALDATAGKIRGGRALTLTLLLEGTDNPDNPGDADEGDAADLGAVEAALRCSNSESWPPLLLAAELLSGDCAQVPGLSVAIARAVAPLVGGLTTDVFVIAPNAEDVTAALHGLAAEARAMRRLVNRFREQCEVAGNRARSFGRGAGSARALLELLAGTPAITVVGAAGALGLTVPTAGAAVARLAGAGLLREITGRGRDRVFVYEPAIALAG